MSKVTSLRYDQYSQAFENYPHRSGTKCTETTPLLKPEAPPPIDPLANNQKSTPISAPITAQLNGKIQKAISNNSLPTNDQTNKLTSIKEKHEERLKTTQDLDTKQRLEHRITQLDLIINHLDSNDENIEIITIGFDKKCTIRTESHKGISQLDTIVLKDKRTNNYEIIRLAGSYSMQKEYGFFLNYLTNGKNGANGANKENAINKANTLDNLKLNNVTMTVAASAASEPIPDWNPFLQIFNHIFEKEEASKSLLENCKENLEEAPHWLDPLWARIGTPFVKKTEKNPLPNRSISRKLFVGTSILGASAVLGVALKLQAAGVALTATGVGGAVGVPLMIGSGITLVGIGFGTIITRQRRHNNAYYVNDSLNKLRRSIEQDKTLVGQSSREGKTPEAVHGLKQNYDRGYGPSAFFRVVVMNGLTVGRSVLAAAKIMPVAGIVINWISSIATPLLDWIRMGPLTDQYRDEEYVAILKALDKIAECEKIKGILKNDLKFDETYLNKNNYYRKKTNPSFWDKCLGLNFRMYDPPETPLDSNQKLQLFLVIGFLYHNKDILTNEEKKKEFLQKLNTEFTKLKSYTEPLVFNIMQKPDKELVKYEGKVISTASYMLLLDKKMNNLLFKKVPIPDKFEQFIPKLPTSSLHKTWDKIEKDRIELLIKKLLSSCENNNKTIKDRNIKNLYTFLDKLCDDNTPLTLTKIRSIVGDIGGHGHIKDVKKRYLVSIEELNKFVDIINRCNSCSDTTQSDSLVSTKSTLLR